MARAHHSMFFYRVAFLFKGTDAEFRVLASTLGLCALQDSSSNSAESFSCVNCLQWPRSKPLLILRQWCEGLLLSVMERKMTLTRVNNMIVV